MYIPPMIIPKKEGCCDDQQQRLPCCENLMAVYPPNYQPGCRSPRWRRRRRWCPPRRRRCDDNIVEIPVPITKVRYLDPIRVPDLILPPLPPPPPRRPRYMMGMGMGTGTNVSGGNYCNCQRGNNHPHYECVCKKC